MTAQISTPDVAPAWSPERRSEMRSHHVLNRDGLSLHARSAGTEGLPLVLLHGYGLSSCIWEGVVELLGPDRRCVALDFRGHGDSQWDAERRYDRDDLAADVIEMLDALHIDQCVLMGHSLGGDVAARVALRFPERVVALGLVDIGPELRAPGLRRVRELTFRTPDSYDSPAEYRAWLQALNPFAQASELTTLARHTLDKRADGTYQQKLDPAFRSALWDDMEPEDAATHEARWAMLRAISQPKLVLRGAISALLGRATAARMAEVLTRTTLEVIPRAGHALMLDNPTVTAAAIGRFLENLENLAAEAA